MSEDSETVVPFPGRVQFSQPGLHLIEDAPKYPSVADVALSTGWWELDQIFRPYPGQFTVVTGEPGCGKSTFLLNLFANLHRRHGSRCFMFVPENETDLYEKLQRIFGRDVNGFKRFCRENYIQSAMLDSYDAPAITLNWVLEQAVAAIEKGGVDFLLIDPWNELDWAKPKDQSMTDYVGDCLKLLKHFARIYQVSIFVVAHPTKARAAGSGPVTLTDIEQSAHWKNKCDNGLILDRDKIGNVTKVVSAKVRKKGSGKIGIAYFDVDEENEQFTPQHGAVT